MPGSDDTIILWCKYFSWISLFILISSCFSFRDYSARFLASVHLHKLCYSLSTDFVARFKRNLVQYL